MAVTETKPHAAAMDMRAKATDYLVRRHYFRWPEALPWLIALACYFVFPDRMTFGNQVLVMVIFALSLDLILGYAGIITLGHAAFFGIGAYVVALAALRLGWSEPISGIIAGGLVAGLVGVAVGWFMLRYRGLTLLMLTIAFAAMLQESGNLRSEFTGGYDGLPGLVFSPLFGLFDYDLYGHVNYLYVLGVLAVVFYFVRRIVYSPFGQALTGIRENVGRMHAIGSPVHWRLVTVYAISAAIAGVAGALFTQTNAYVTLTVFDFDNSAKVMVMLILGGTGRLYGAFLGAVVYMYMEDYFSKLSPTFWQLGIGLMLVLVVLFARRGLLGLLEDAGAVAYAEEAVMTAALDVRGTEPQFRRAACHARRQSHARGRRPPRADRAERRRQDHVGQSDHRRHAALGRPRVAQRRGHHRARPGATGAARAGAHLPDQSAVPRPDGARKHRHDHRRARRQLQQHVAFGRRQARGDRRGARSSGVAAHRRRRAQAGARIALWPPAAGGDRHRAGADARACCCSTSRRRACRPRKAISSSTWWPRSIPTSPS